MLTMKWQLDIPDETYYNKLVGGGMAFELYPTLPLTWTETELEIWDYKTKVEYCRKTRDSNFEASCKLEELNNV
jgi:hypothetical protein